MFQTVPVDAVQVKGRAGACLFAQCCVQPGCSAIYICPSVKYLPSIPSHSHHYHPDCIHRPIPPRSPRTANSRSHLS
ncbi:hypothetical protein M405DRAFT_358227 [Rhizopogon salebrosus TDB-379]|nr:hypothetical protein M405DRAFT_358227 [Rhizopogon salebrosus TDB-379]